MMTPDISFKSTELGAGELVRFRLQAITCHIAQTAHFVAGLVLQVTSTATVVRISKRYRNNMDLADLKL